MIDFKYNVVYNIRVYKHLVVPVGHNGRLEFSEREDNRNEEESHHAQREGGARRRYGYEHRGRCPGVFWAFSDLPQDQRSES